MKNITYLFGAGASIGAVPVVNQIESRITEQIKHLSTFKEKLSTSRIKVHNLGVSPNHYKGGLETIINELNWMKDACKTHTSIDTFAKKLFLIPGNSSDLKRLKRILSFFFAIEQLLYKPNPRYDTFYASILNEKINGFPSNIKILSWNYDNQFEIAYSDYSGVNEIKHNREQIKLFTHSNNIKSSSQGFKLMKLNGSADFIYPDRDDKHMFLEDSNELNTQKLQHLIGMFLFTIKFPSMKPELSFAWEEKNRTDYMDAVINEIKDTNVVVVIGYSFPYFNRAIDRKIFNSMVKLEKVYFQSDKPEIPHSRFSSVRNDLPPDKLIQFSEVEQFLIPGEM